MRPPWSALPVAARAAVEDWLGGPVQHAVDVRGGWTPAVAARVRAGDRTAFVKALLPGSGDELAGIFRAEIRVAAALPEAPCLAPLRWSHDSGGVIALGFDDLGGPSVPLPWRAADLDAVLLAVTQAHAALTPAPVAASSAGQLPFDGWARLRGDEPGLGPWSRRHLDALRAVAWPPELPGETLLHADLRADNVVLAPGRGPVLVDWSDVHLGPPWLDLVLLAPSVEAEGGPSCAALVDRASTRPPPDALVSVVAGLAGYCTERALRPPPPTAGPGLRAYQERLAVPARRWAAQLLDLR